MSSTATVRANSTLRSDDRGTAHISKPSTDSDNINDNWEVDTDARTEIERRSKERKKENDQIRRWHDTQVKGKSDKPNPNPMPLSDSECDNLRGQYRAWAERQAELNENEQIRCWYLMSEGGSPEKPDPNHFNHLLTDEECDQLRPKFRKAKSDARAIQDWPIVFKAIRAWIILNEKCSKPGNASELSEDECRQRQAAFEQWIRDEYAARQSRLNADVAKLERQRKNALYADGPELHTSASPDPPTHTDPQQPPSAPTHTDPQPPSAPTQAETREPHQPSAMAEAQVQHNNTGSLAWPPTTLEQKPGSHTDTNNTSSESSAEARCAAWTNGPKADLSVKPAQSFDDFREKKIREMTTNGGLSASVSAAIRDNTAHIINSYEKIIVEPTSQSAEKKILLDVGKRVAVKALDKYGELRGYQYLGQSLQLAILGDPAIPALGDFVKLIYANDRDDALSEIGADKICDTPKFVFEKIVTYLVPKIEAFGEGPFVVLFEIFETTDTDKDDDKPNWQEYKGFEKGSGSHDGTYGPAEK